MDGLEWKTMEHLVELDDGGISVFYGGKPPHVEIDLGFSQI